MNKTKITAILWHVKYKLLCRVETIRQRGQNQMCHPGLRVDWNGSHGDKARRGVCADQNQTFSGTARKAVISRSLRLESVI